MSAKQFLGQALLSDYLVECTLDVMTDSVSVLNGNLS